MKKQYLEVGEIVSTHGLRGEVRVKVWGDSPEFLTAFDTLYLSEGEISVDVLSSRIHKNVAVLMIDGYSTVEDAAKLRGKILFINRDDVQLPSGRYFVQDLLGFSVVDMRINEGIGKLDYISNLGAGDLYHVKCFDGKEALIPAVPEFVKEVDVSSETINITTIKGLIDQQERYYHALTGNLGFFTLRKYHR